MATPRDLKVQMAGETRARERAQALAATQTARARQAEAATQAAEAERDAWKARALAAEAELERLRALLGGRPILLGASTHPGDEALLAVAHAELARRLPGLLLVLVPRHPDRGEALARELPGAVRRSLGEVPGPGTGIWIADTLGELGLFYRLAGAAVIGKSLLPPGGGQNPLEPARLGCPVILGPHMQNFAAISERLLAEGGAVRLPDAAALADVAAAVLTDRQHAARLRHAGARVAADAAGLADRMALAVAALLPPR